jgi:hypothetical protein
MPTLEELRAKLHTIRDQIPSILLEVATSVALTGKALSERTIKDKGFGEMYSSNKVPAWFMTGKELNATGAAFIDKKLKGKTKEEQLTNWKEFRAAQGLQTGYVDLSYDNEMWSGMFPRDAYQKGTEYLAPLAHNNTEGQNKMNWNRDRYGDFIGKVLSGENFDIMGNVAIEEFTRLAFERNNL